MSDYDLIAPFYDIEHARFDDDLDMYQNYAGLSSGPLLELACGSGRLLVPLAHDGYTLTGVDNSVQMLALAQARLQEEGLLSRVTLIQQDITSLQLLPLPQKYRLAFIALGSFGHITTRKAQQQTLQAIRAHLAVRGTLIIDISNADARYMEQMHNQMLHQGSWQQEDGTCLTHFVSPASSTARHLLELTHFYDRHSQGGTVTRTVSTTYLYLFERSEMELLLETAGFTVKDVYGSYDLGPYTLDSDRMILIAEAH
ncbi:MAG TPA: class I SAM-dependent methyltransferase [Ktedonobacteraceae bacterium]|nr:class I SAM-dependent methyltransferase [Ktedonobacteraceae bacterium]